MSSLPLMRAGKPAGFARDARFATLLGGAAEKPAEAAPKTDPVVEAYQRGYREGADGSSQAHIPPVS